MLGKNQGENPRFRASLLAHGIALFLLCLTWLVGVSSSDIIRGIVAISSNEVWAVGKISSASDSEYAFAFNVTELGGSVTPTVSPSPAPTYTPTPTTSPTATLVAGCTLSWDTVPSPGGSPTSYTNLASVAIAASNDIWAVGNIFNQSPHDRPYDSQELIEHWDGIQWSIVPGNVNSTSILLNGVAVVSANDVWAVGVDNFGALTLHWDGVQWNPMPNPGQGGSKLKSVAAIASDDVWAVGLKFIAGGSQTFIMHWDGASWRVVPSPNSTEPSNYLTSVAAVASNDIWAIGDSSSNQPLIEHWDGVQWSLVLGPDLGHPILLTAVSALSANDVWAVGRYERGVPVGSNTLTLHWDGGQWSVVSSPNPSTRDNALYGVAGVASDDVWAVGITAEYRTLTEHWDGNAWSIIPSSNPGGISNYLFGVAAGEDSSWAVGNFQNWTDPQATLVERYTGLCPTVTPTPTATATVTSTATPCPVNFLDVHLTDYFYGAVSYFYCAGVISGYSDGTFRPYNNATRGQVCKIVALAEGWQLQCPQTGHFTDVPPDSPFYCYVETAYGHDVISGYDDGTFRWGNNVTRGQLCKIVMLAEGWPWRCTPTGHFTDVPLEDPFYCFVETAYANGVISGYADGTFRPVNNAIRGQISKIVYFALTNPPPPTFTSTPTRTSTPTSLPNFTPPTFTPLPWFITYTPTPTGTPAAAHP